MSKTKKLPQNRKHTGFTLVETLLVVGIILVLLALIAPNVISARRSMAQKGLDAKAEIIYTAAQNQLVKLRAAGKEASYCNGHSLDKKPSDAVTQNDENGHEIPLRLLYITSPDPGGDGDAIKAVAAAVLPEGAVDAELRGAHWVIEYSAETCSVYAVFYSEDVTVDKTYQTKWDVCDDLRAFKNRRDGCAGIEGATVGYYGGDAKAESGGENGDKPQAWIDIENGEKLLAKLYCTAPTASKSANFKFRVTLTDEPINGNKPNSVTLTFTTDANNDQDKLSWSGWIYSKVLTLDDLTTDAYGNQPNRFHAKYPTLTPGTKLTVTLSATGAEDACRSTNSLFADMEGKTAYVSCGRHLQNLDVSSGVSGITEARQTADISFAVDDSAWYDAYGRKAFRPITKGELETYDGGGNTITGLYVADAVDGKAGLFASANGLTVQDLTLAGADVSGDAAGALSGAATGCAFENITLIDTKVSGTTAGALSGTASGGSVTNCRAYLKNPQPEPNGEIGARLTGATAGGLIGAVTGGTVSVTQSFAATVLWGTEHGGGLVGSVDAGTADISRSYADNYITGKMLGGLVGSGNAQLRNCYAAGFLTATAGGSAAGLINISGTPDAKTCYTICALDGDGEARDDTTMCYYGVGGVKEGRITPEMEESRGALLALLGGEDGAFTALPGQTHCYRRLPPYTDKNYPYPFLDDLSSGVLPHYGNWKTEFRSGALVYYEIYQEPGGALSYGVSGGGREALDNEKIVVGDGYGMLYLPSDVPETMPEVLLDGEAVENAFDPATEPYSVKITEKGAQVDYLVYPLPASVSAPDLEGTGFYHRVTIGEEDFAFQPWLAQTARGIGREDPLPAPDAALYIRTPRHLRALSLYYDKCFAGLRVTENGKEKLCAYEQVRDIDFAAYHWLDFAGCSAETARTQEPIGAKGFSASYDGGCHLISNVSIVSASADCVGLFGKNLGEVKNVVLAMEYIPDSSDSRYYIQRTEPIQNGKTAYMGVLAGYNGGTIENCAVASYYVSGADGTLHVYEYSTLNAGGLAGYNAGTIKNCSADCPAIRVSATVAEVSLGGFVGRNAGTISNSCAIGHIEAAFAEDGVVRLAGFAGYNEGRIGDSYCATSLIASGSAHAYAFAPKGGSVRSCLYLDKGTYSYVGTLRSYSADTAVTSGKSVTFSELCDTQSKGYADESHSHRLFVDPEKVNQGGEYPYRAVVRGVDGMPVHYGDWQDEASLGEMGVFYWEYEEDGSNSGYHFSYVGTEGDLTFKGDTLCRAHDDGGVVKENGFGYGYYARESLNSRVTLTSEDIAVSVGADGMAGAYSADAKAALESQVLGYVFYPYTTRYAASGDYVYLSGTDVEGKWTLKCGGETEVYRVAPFFANAIRLEGHAGKNVSVKTSDGYVTNYLESLGTESDVGKTGNPFEIRSTAQLQYINWNYENKSCDRLVTKDNYQQFPYLMATDSTGTAEQKLTGTVYRWRQSHDLDGANFRHDPDDPAFRNYTPIAGLGEVARDRLTGKLIDVLYAWFGGSYDGQSYKIQNLKIESDSHTVGLFGVTASAVIKNVILYGDTDNAVISRVTPNEGGQVNNGDGDCMIGGLIGVAYRYKDEARSDVTISNCAVAGYRIEDHSSNKLGNGSANIGGLIGAANVDLEKCSAVTNITIACTHPQGHPEYGSYIRVGGLTGAALYQITDCYTGGSISIDPQTLNEMPADYKAGKDIDRSKICHIFVAGVSASAYATNFQNFTKSSNQQQSDRTPVLNNCYTYAQLPDISGNVRAVTLIAGPADRYNRGTRIIAHNCYCLKSVHDAIGLDQPTYAFSQAKEKKYRLTEEDKETMLNGDLRVLCKTLYNQSTGSHGYVPDLTTLVTFDQLSGKGEVTDVYHVTNEDIYAALDRKYENYDEVNDLHMLSARAGSAKAWAPVTTTEGAGASIDGKFSFPGIKDELLGKNYPFPTVVRQNDLTYGTVQSPHWVNVHYGEWPNDGCYWEKGRDSMDIFGDMVTDAASPSFGWAEKTFYLYDLKDAANDRPNGDLGGAAITEDDLRIGSTGVVRVIGVGAPEESEGGWRYAVTLRALTDGAVRVRLQKEVTEDRTVEASFMLQVTHALSLTADPPAPTFYYNVEKELTLSAHAAASAEKKDYSLAGAWLLSPSEADDVYSYSKASFEKDPESSYAANVWPVTGLVSGRRTLRADYTYDYHSKEGGKEYTETLLVPDCTLGVVGLGSAAELNELRRAPGGGTGSKLEENAYAEGEGPVAPYSAEFFLYETASDEALGALNVDSIAADTEGAAGSFTVSLEDAVETDGLFEYRLGTLTYTGGETPPESARLTVTAHYGEDERYTFTAEIGAIPIAHVSFDANGGTGTMHSIPILAGKETKTPACAFERTGYTFAGWNMQPDGKGIAYAPDDALPAATLTLYAQWQANAHTLTLRAGASDEALKKEFAVKTGDAALDGYAADDWGKDGWTLEGWFLPAEEDPDDLAAALLAGRKVLNADGSIALSELDGFTKDNKFTLSEDRTLYARWKTEAFVPADKLTDGADYLLIGDTVRYTLKKNAVVSESLDTSEGRAALSANMTATAALKPIVTQYVSEIVANSGETAPYAGDGTAIERYIPFAEAKAPSIWSAKFSRFATTTKEKAAYNGNGVEKGTPLEVFSLYNEAKEKYLIRNGSYIGLADKLGDDLTYLVYGKFLDAETPVHSLECAKWAIDGGGDCFCWTGGNDWVIQKNYPQNNVFCYEKTTIYAFE